MGIWNSPRKVKIAIKGCSCLQKGGKQLRKPVKHVILIEKRRKICQHFVQHFIDVIVNLLIINVVQHYMYSIFCSN